jgi:putative endonuclease
MTMSKGGHVYIMTNAGHTTLYTGVTSELRDRVIQHKEKTYPDAFTARYNLNKLVYYEFHDSIEGAIDREKQVKAGSRQKKIQMINSMNPDWRDLWEDIEDW